MILAGEAFMLGKKAGIDLTALFGGIKASSGNSYTIEIQIPLVYNGSYDVGFSLALACKLDREHGVPLELGGLIEQIFIRAKVQYGDDKNSTQAIQLQEDALNVYLRFIYIGKTKTLNPRQIPINDDLAALFKRIRQRQGLKSSPYVFTYQQKPIESLKNGFKAALKMAGIEDFRFHGLRPLQATL